MPSESEVAWAAGFFEGEGSFSIQRRLNDPYRVPLPTATVTNSDLEMLRRFHRIVGVGNVTGPRKNYVNKPIYDWQASGGSVAFIFALFEPWLSERRLLRGSEVLADGQPDENQLYLVA